MYGCGRSDGDLDGAIFKQEVGTGWLPKMAHSAHAYIRFLHPKACPKKYTFFTVLVFSRMESMLSTTDRVLPYMVLMFLFSSKVKQTSLENNWINFLIYPTYKQHSDLSYVCDSGGLILYHQSKSIPWVLSIPWVHVNKSCPWHYHESISIPQVLANNMTIPSV